MLCGRIMSSKGLSLQQLSQTPAAKAALPCRKVRNRQYAPSDDDYDDEDEGDDDEDDEDDENECYTTTKPTLKTPCYPTPSSSTASHIKQRNQNRKVTPLPSDDEDEDGDDDTEDEDDKLDMKQRLYRLQGVQSSSQLDNYTVSNKTFRPSKKTMGGGQRHSAGDSNSMTLTSYDSDDESVLPQFLKDHHQFQQWQYMQQYQQAQMMQVRQHQQLKPHPGYYYHPHPIKSHQRLPQQYVLSGMELLAQREQDIADAKRQKPKLDPAHAKIEGLLAKLPEPGAHNISFQQMYQQHRHISPTTRSHSSMIPPLQRQPPRSISAMSLNRR